jgi:hypothetical protein
VSSILQKRGRRLRCRKILRVSTIAVLDGEILRGENTLYMDITEVFDSHSHSHSFLPFSFYSQLRVLFIFDLYDLPFIFGRCSETASFLQDLVLALVLALVLVLVLVLALALA